MSATTERRPAATGRLTVFRLINADFTQGGDRRLIRQQAIGADLLAIVEARDGANRPLMIAGWLTRWAVEHSAVNGAMAGSALAVRNAKKRIRVAGSRLKALSRGNSKVQTRYLRASRVWVRDVGWTWVGVLHLPLKSSGQQFAAMRETRAWVQRHLAKGRRVMVLLDGNMHPAAVARYLGLPRHFGADVMCAAWSKGWPPIEKRAYRVPGSDHHVLELVVGRDRREYRTGEFGKAPR